MNCRFKFILFTLILCLFGHASKGLGQVVVDNSFGNAGALSGPDFKIPDLLGKTVGDNLFHSFSEFSLQTGQSATFTGPDAVSNILGRVTGGNVSEIDGLIKSDIAGANLYLMNPNGFLFGENSKVDVDGSFTVSSRDRIDLGKDGVFLATDSNKSVFTASPPQAFGFLGSNPAGKITFNGTLLVTGGDINVAGGEVLLDKARIVSVSANDNSGNIIVEADTVMVRKGQLRSESLGGKSGSVSIHSKGGVLIDDNSGTVTSLDKETGHTGGDSEWTTFIPSNSDFDNLLDTMSIGELLGVKEEGVKEEVLSPQAINENNRNLNINFGVATGLMSLANGGNTGDITISASSIILKSAGVYSITSKDADGNLGQAGNIKLQSGVTQLENSRIQFGSGLSAETAGGVDIFAQNGMIITGQSYLYSRAGLKLTGGVAIIGASLVEAGSSTVQLGSGMKLEANSAWNSPTIDIQAAALEVFSSNIQYETEMSIKLGGDLKVAKGNPYDWNSKGSLIAGNVLLPSTLEISGRNMTVDGGSRVHSGLGADISLSGAFTLLNSSRVQVGIDQEKNLGTTVSFPEGQQLGHLSLKAGDIAIAPGVQGSNFKLFTQYGGAMSLESGGVITLESNGEVYLTDYASNPESKLTVEAGGMLIDAAGLRGDEIEVDVRGRLQIGKPGAPYSSGIYGGPKDPRLIDVTAGELFMYGTGGIVLQKEGVEEVYGGEIKAYVAQTFLIDNNIVSTRGYFKDDHSNIAVGSIDIDAGNLVLQNNAKIEMNSGEVPEGVEVGTLDIDAINLLLIENSTISISAIGAESARAAVSVRGKHVELTSAKIEHANYFSKLYNQGDIYLRDTDEPVILPGYGTLDITASATLVSKEGTLVSMQNGAVKMAAGEMMLDGTTVETETHWLQDSQGRNSQLSLTAAGQLLLLNSRFNMETVSSGGRQTFSATAPVVQFKNSTLTLSDEVAGQAGSVTILGSQSLLVEGSEISSVGMNTIDAGVNGNDITVGGGAVSILSSVINTTVHGSGDAGQTKVSGTKSFSLGDSWIGGAGSTLGQVQPMNVVTDGSWGEAATVGGAVPLDGSLGLAKGENQFFSLASLALFNGQRLSFANFGDDAQRVIARVTGGESSVLDGTIHLGANPADLVLMNPSGFEVGPNAQFSQVGALTLFAGNAVEFNGGVKVDLETAGDALPETKPVGFITETRGDVQVIAATLGQAGSTSSESGLTVIGDEVSFRSGGAALIGNGGDVRINAASLTLSGGSVIGTVSPVGQAGGAIRIDAGTVSLEDGNIRTVAAGGNGGKVLISGGSFRANGGSVQSVSFGSEPAGAVTIVMDESINGVMDSFVDASSFGAGGLSPVRLKAASVVLDGPDFDRASGVKMIAYQGPTSTISIEGSVIAAPMGRLINEARADAELTVGDGYGSISLSGDALSLGLASEGEVPKTMDNSLSFYTHSKNAGQTGNISAVAENDLNFGGIEIAQLGLLLAGKGFVDGPVGRGGDVLFKGRNVFGQPIPVPVLWFSGFFTGNVNFVAQDTISFGLARMIYVNSDPSVRHNYSFNAKSISLGFDPEYNPERWGTFFVLTHADIGEYVAPGLVMRAQEKIMIYPGFQTNDDFDTIGPHKGLPGGNGFSTIDIETKAMEINASKFSLHSNYDHRIIATDYLKLNNSAQIEIKDSDTEQNPSIRRINIKTGQLEMSSGAYLRSVTESNYNSADWQIEADTIQLDQARIYTESLSNGRAGNISMKAKSILLTNVSELKSQMHDAGDSGSILIKAESIGLSNESFLYSGVPLSYNGFNPDKMQPGAYGDAGDILLEANDIKIESGSSLANTALDIGVSGDIAINCKNLLINNSFINNFSEPTQLIGQHGVFNASFLDAKTPGCITINSDSIKLSGSRINAASRIFFRDGGDILLSANNIHIDDDTVVYSSLLPSSKIIEALHADLGTSDLLYTTNAGTIKVEANEIILNRNSTLLTDTYTPGGGGKVSLIAENIKMENSSSISSSTWSSGNAGKIDLNSTDVSLISGATIGSNTNGSGSGGVITLNADQITLNTDGNSGIASITSYTTLNKEPLSAKLGGNGGSIQLNAKVLNLQGNSQILTDTLGIGKGGMIQINADILNLDGSLLSSSSTGEGNAGSIELNLEERLELAQGSIVSVSSALANGGDITIQTGGHVLVDNSELSASAKLDGGSVRLYGDGNFFFRDGRITAEAGQDGGNIFVEAPETLVLQRSSLSANAAVGHGGYIQITADGFLRSIETSITASSEFGVQGSVEIRTPATDTGSGLVVLPETLVSRDINLAERCALPLADDLSSFFLKGQGGIPVWASQGYLPTVIVSELGDTNWPSDRSDEQ
ncbi:filamentous hemagglutinin N-terminal domain-containing protein [bacterium]|nr:filamentous hemagglutinin N-terminal domain-containing protein [bacterium]